VGQSNVILIFLDDEYIKSKNCETEWIAAAYLKKPIVLVYESDKHNGGGAIEVLLERFYAKVDVWVRNHVECASARTIPWQHDGELQTAVIEQIASWLLTLFTRTSISISHEDQRHEWTLPGKSKVYITPDAPDLKEELQKKLRQAEFPNDSPNLVWVNTRDEADFHIVYLHKQTFKSDTPTKTATELEDLFQKIDISGGVQSMSSCLCRTCRFHII
jgi:hypothetical protein